MCVVQDSQLRFVHTISWGGDRLTGALIADTGCSPEEAQAIVEDEHAAVDLKGVLTWGAAEDQQSTIALAPEFDRLRREVQRLLNYYRSLFPERSYEGILDRLALSGGSANLKGMKEFFAEAFQAEVTTPNPFQSFASHLMSDSFAAMAGHSTSFVVAIGLALGSFEGSARSGDKETDIRRPENLWRRKAA